MLRVNQIIEKAIIQSSNHKNCLHGSKKLRKSPRESYLTLFLINLLGPVNLNKSSMDFMLPLPVTPESGPPFYRSVASCLALWKSKHWPKKAIKDYSVESI